MSRLGPMARPVILILGGYGVFGRRIAANLARHEEIDLVIAGRNPNAAATFVRSLGPSRARSLAVDLARPDAISTLIAAKPAILVDTLGPFQVRNLALPRRCAERGIHYIDIADASARVVDIASLDAVARVEHAAAPGLDLASLGAVARVEHDAVISGASTVPAPTAAVVGRLVPNAREVVAIDVGITPGQRTPRGMATVRAILGYCGKPITSVCGDEAIYGWGDLTRHAYPEPVGERWLSNVDTPERALWRARYPALEEASIRAGLAIGVLHLGLSALSRGVRLGVLPSLERFAKPLNRVADFFDRVGTDAGAMHVRVTARDAHARTTSRTATLVAENGDGDRK